jgi:hypothetical protein
MLYRVANDYLHRFDVNVNEMPWCGGVLRAEAACLP